MTIKAIVCMDLNNAIGYKNELLCKLPNDMKRFKQLTLGTGNNSVLCGSKTYESMGNLPNRYMIVATKSKTYEGVHTTKNVEDFTRLWKTYSPDKDLWILGGEEIYKQTLDYVDELHITVVTSEFTNVDTYFPAIDEGVWEVVDVEKHYKDELHSHNYAYWTLKRKTTLH